MPTNPSNFTVRMYNVGFGDCFLLTIHYAKPLKDQHILIDFGSVAGKADLKAIAKEIKKECDGKLYAVIATHRHRDHISGFSDAGGKDSPGAIIASCKPEIVLQPWTENPDAAAKATSAPLFSKKKTVSDEKLFFASMSAMNAFAEAVVQQAPQWRGVGGHVTSLENLAINNVSNPDAVKNLRKMGKQRPRFLQYGSPSGLENSKMLPGVRVHVLGPPTLKEQNNLKYAKKSDEYWIACKYWGLQESASHLLGKVSLFRNQSLKMKKLQPFQARWFIQHADAAFRSNIFGIVTALDCFLNNTSLILLFEINGKKLLFPGDAQLENWSWALSQPGTENLLKDVDFYKVGHHGSRNATPMSLWTIFSKRRGMTKSTVLKTMMSTSAGPYARTEEGKVPSTNLVKALQKGSVLKNTQKLKGARGPMRFEF